MKSDIGIVVIGRNEGERLKESLVSALPYQPHVVYVDSGSVDGSAALARAMEISVLEMDSSEPYTPARGRNEGAHYLERKYKHLRYVQFLDGDCELIDGSPEKALERMMKESDCGVVAGFSREKNRDYSNYTRLLDVEWQCIWEPRQGPVDKTGGDILVRIEALEGTGGFRQELLGGEEPELCIRMKAAGWGICKIDEKMSVHDGSKANLSGWVCRHIRFGWAVSEIRKLYKGSEVGLYRENDKRIWNYGIWIPAISLVLGFQSPVVAFLFWSLACCAKATGTYREVKNRGISSKDSRLYAVDSTLGLILQGVGKIVFFCSRYLGQFNVQYVRLLYHS